MKQIMKNEEESHLFSSMICYVITCHEILLTVVVYRRVVCFFDLTNTNVSVGEKFTGSYKTENILFSPTWTVPL